MSPPLNTPAFRAVRGSVQTILLGGLALALASVVLLPLMVPAALYLSLRPSGSLDVVRQAVARSARVDLEPEIEIALRPAACALLRAGAALADHPPELHAALGAVRAVEVGVYQVASSKLSAKPRDMLGDIDRAMAARGWERVVGVMNAGDMVAVFAPQKIRSHRDLSLAVLVFDGSRLVAASIRGDPEAVIDLALEHAPRHHAPRLALTR
ncbi:MAG TPA: hypothetical protein PKM43_00815 [Verrucomicrobiota bacterium]|nr:hypothetical protein [Verrucomicrobiota bacterium]HRZ34995.1 hypothetical protein [Candidatus Paceibacterota bacterium]